MKLHVERKKDTQALLEIEASAEELKKIKKKVLTQLSGHVKVSGFRKGKVPLAVVEKNVDQDTLQSEFVNEAVNMLYIAALKEERIRPVGQPKVEVKKFVPFTTLEITLDIPVVGEIKLPDYKKMSVKKEDIKVTADQVKEVLTNLQTRGAEKVEVKRAAKDGDEAWIDFEGTDADGKPIEGASGTDYPLALGSNTFIPGFEDNVAGMKIGDEKSFELTFPKDYGSKELQNKKVTFKVTLKKVNEVQKAKLDDEFAKKVGPFKSLDELKDNIKKQLQADSDQKAERDYEAKLVNTLADKTKVAIPDSLIEEQQEMVIQEVRQNAMQRGMMYEDFLKQSGVTEEEFIEKEVKPESIRRVKAGLVLSEIADKEGIDVSPEELEARIQQLKGQYKDPKMQEELDKPENRREINARLRSEKVIHFLK